MSDVPFTQAGLSKVAGQKGSRLVIHDPKVPGLRAELREGGALAFYVFKRSPGGSPIRVRLGAFPEISVDEARTAAKRLIAEIASGENPAQIKRQKRGEATLLELFEHWRETHAKPHKKTWHDDQRQFDKYLEPWHKRKLSAITKTDVVARHAKLGKEHGPYQANRVLSLLRALYNKADELAYEGRNPAAKVRPFKETSRDRFLQPDELPRFFTALAAEPNQTLRDFFVLAIFTGARRSNVTAMRWADIDLEQAIWRIPDTKPGRSQYVPLVEPVMAILERRKPLAAESEFVLPGRGKTGHLVEVKTAWARLLKRAELENIRPHDLRRTLGSYMAIQGASLHIIGATLGHSQAQTTAVYARLTSNAVAENVTSAVKLIEQKANPPQKKT